MSDDDEQQYKKDVKRAKQRLKSATQRLDDLVVAIDDHMASLRREKPATKTELSATIQEMGKLQTHVNEEMRKYGRHVLEQKGLVADAPLDLDAIRLEVGGFLDRIRAAASAGRIPSGAEQ